MCNLYYAVDTSSFNKGNIRNDVLLRCRFSLDGPESVVKALAILAAVIFGALAITMCLVLHAFVNIISILINSLLYS